MQCHFADCPSARLSLGVVTKQTLRSSQVYVVGPRGESQVRRPLKALHVQHSTLRAQRWLRGVDTYPARPARAQWGHKATCRSARQERLRCGGNDARKDASLGTPLSHGYGQTASVILTTQWRRTMRLPRADCHTPMPTSSCHCWMGAVLSVTGARCMQARAANIACTTGLSTSRTAAGICCGISALMR